VLEYRGAALDTSQGIFLERWALPKGKIHRVDP
jgi:hypothetical protein